MKKFLVMLIISGFVMISSVSGLELKEGRIKLILHEDSGRISIFYQDKLVSNEYTSLLLKQDPRTSGIILLIDNKSLRMGSNFEFDQKIEETRNGAAFIWTSNRLKVTQSFSFITSEGGAIADGVKSEIVIENISNDSISVGVKYLFDTYLGENGESDAHFFTSNGSAVSSETVLEGLLPDYWVSSQKTDSTTGFLSMLGSNIVTPPDKVVFANWKRLDESAWLPTTKTGRNFNLLPYSINDSAAAQYYNQVRLPAGSKRTVTLVFGNTSEKGFSTSNKVESSSTLDDLYKRVLTKDDDTSVVSLQNAVKNELTLTEDLITNIDRFLNSEKPLSKSEIEALEAMIETLENTKEKFED
jgi:hypothetical protein